MALPPSTQEAVAPDYAANITYGATILSRKWKDLHGRSMMINNGHPQWLENWFLALCPCNSGFYPAGHKGVGWTTNPANPLWKAKRVPFLQHALDPHLDDYSHAAHPQGLAVRGEGARLGRAPDIRDVRARRLPGRIPGRLVEQRRGAFHGEAATGNVLRRVQFLRPVEDLGQRLQRPRHGRLFTGLRRQRHPPARVHCRWDKSAEWKNCDTLAERGHQVHRFNTSHPEQARNRSARAGTAVARNT
ncbi:hypothetical protein AB0C61_34780 [Streptomyces sp. NPDC048680]|uniref:hypothetical protein n=1 Tax=Streptomyces sp. NPDC048680 TaxID=3155492 RepID=UPI00342FD5DB